MKAFGRLLLAGVAGSLASGQALAEDATHRPYVTIFGGFGWPVGFVSAFIDNTPPFEGDRFEYLTRLDNGALIGGAIGFNLRPGAIRTELEVGRVAFNAGEYFGITQTDPMTPPIVGEGVEGFVRATTAMVNTWLTVTTGPVETYVGGGLGVGLITAEMTTTNDGDQFEGTGFAVAYQLGLGAIFRLSERVAMDLGYRLRGTIGGRLDSQIVGYDAEARTLGVHVGLLGFTFGY